MLEQLQESLGKIVKTLRSEGKITENNIRDTLRSVRRSLLEADVNYKVVKEFIDNVQAKAIGITVTKSLTPGRQVVKIFNDELTRLLGAKQYHLKTASMPPTVILLAGLQGCGKTTFAAKLALMLKNQNRKPLLVSVDVYRPAAMQQLEILGKQIGVPVFSDESKVVKRATEAVEFARKQHLDTVIVDTAGRLHIDKEMMKELDALKKNLKPQNILFVADGMTGQDAVNTAASFNDQLGFDGIILTKMDSDTRGGAALSIVSVTGKPIMYIGTGEKPENIEAFHPDRIANRILGMGDVVSLVEKVQAAIDVEQAEKLEKKLLKQQFTLEDYLDQLKQIKKMGPIGDILDMIPGFSKLKSKNIKVDDRELTRAEVIIQSMTRQERQKPNLINGSRRKRIARGSGTQPSDVNRLLNQYWQLVKMSKQMSKMKLPANLSAFGM
ncbi:signal recognition particle protein [bacterium]|nr:signal recognition particle protein [bacterium]MBU1634569.1 signal recognition particle protein [bacterium]MBU1873117.1 signal recognition particle protein [bacterium]